MCVTVSLHFLRSMHGRVNPVKRAVMPYDPALARVTRAHFLLLACFAVYRSVASCGSELHPARLLCLAAAGAHKFAGGVVNLVVVRLRPYDVSV